MMVTGVSSSVASDPKIPIRFAEGGSFTGVTVIATGASAELSTPSLAVKVKPSDPLKFTSGI